MSTPLQLSLDDIQTAPHFDGVEYNSVFDHARLTGQMQRIYSLMADQKFRTLDEISRLTGDPAASVSAQLRNLRKVQFGNHTINRRARGERSHGLYEYQLIPNV